MHKYTQGSAKGAPDNRHSFDRQRIKIALLQRDFPTEFEPSTVALCPALLRCRVEIKQADKEKQRLANVLKQRERRATAKALQVDAVRSAQPWTVAPDGSLTWDEPAAPAQAAAPAQPAPAPRVGARLARPAAELAAATADLEASWKASRRAKKRRESSDELLVHTIDVTPPQTKAQERAVKSRSECLKTGNLLLAREEKTGVLDRAAGKIRNCGLWGLYQSINQDVNYKIGTALCKCRLCPNCQRVLAAKKRGGSLDWFAENRKALKKYFFYHMVLTVRHSVAAGVRNHLYTPELLSYFAQLRGTDKSLSGAQRRQRSAEWKSAVAGGSYSVEIKAGRDGSPHIHIHCLLVGRKMLYNKAKDSKFQQRVKAAWRDITGDSDNVFIEPVYYLDENAKKVPAFKGSDLDVSRAVAECMKYTIKADAASLADYSNGFLVDLLTFKNRYYGRFGCLSSNDKTSAQFTKMELLRLDYQDLEQVTKDELARLMNPETGEIVEQEETCFIATPQRNMRPVPIEVEHQSAELESVKMVPSGKYWPQDGTALAGSPILVPKVGAATLDATPPRKAPMVYYKGVDLPPHLAAVQYQYFPYQERQRAAIWLSRSIAGDYSPAIEFDGVHEKK